MTLEDLVPPLELCKKIPEGSFADSAFIRVVHYSRDGQIISDVLCREDIDYTDAESFPAPTLQEILNAIQPYDEGSPAEAALSLWLREHEVAE